MEKKLGFNKRIASSCLAGIEDYIERRCGKGRNITRVAMQDQESDFSLHVLSIISK